MPTICLKPTIEDVGDCTALWYELPLSTWIFKRVHIKFGKAPLLGDTDHLAARELNFT